VARRFRFTLETLLRVREIREREAQRKVAVKQAEIARLDQLDRQTAAEIAARQQELRACQQQARLAPDELARRRAWIACLRRTVGERQALRAGLVKELEQLQAELRQARVQRRTISRLRERRWEDYLKNRRRREQSEADELARVLLAAQRARDPDQRSGRLSAVGYQLDRAGAAGHPAER